MKKKILVLPSWYPSITEPHYALFIQAQAHTLALRYDTQVLYPEPVLWRHILARRIPPPHYRENRQGVTTTYERAMIWWPKHEEYLYPKVYQAARCGFEKLLVTWGRPDLIHAHTVLPGGWIACQLGQLYGIPVVLTEHTGPFSLQLKTPYLRRLVRETLSRVDGIIAVSPEMKRQILAFQPGLDIEVLGNVILTDFFIPLNEPDPEDRKSVQFLTVAGLVPEKGLDDLLEATQLLAGRRPGRFEVVIGGDGPDRRRLNEKVKSLGLSRTCRFLGALTRDQVRQAMQSCDVFVLPSHGETFGVVLGEAMACGKPVIATRCGGPEFFVTPENGVVIEPNRPAALADAMEMFLRKQIHLDPCRIRESVVQRFGQESFLNQLGRLYDGWFTLKKELAGIGMGWSRGSDSQEIIR